jgi:hypothetical protein
MENNNQQQKYFYKQIISNFNYDFDSCLEWMKILDKNFGYISFAQYIRIIEGKDFTRDSKDILFDLAYQKLDFGYYENFFEPSKSINELNQKMFLIMSIEILIDYLGKKNKNKKYQSFIIWEVIAKYYIQEHKNLVPYDNYLFSTQEYSSMGKIYNFFKQKDIDIQEKMNLLNKQPSFYKNILNYFYLK